LRPSGRVVRRVATQLEFLKTTFFKPECVIQKYTIQFGLKWLISKINSIL